MSPRYIRLASPGAAFLLIGIILLLLASYARENVRGGLAVSAVFAVLVQSVLALLLLVRVDDLEEPILAAPRWGRSAAPGTDDATSDIVRALRVFYGGRVLPAAALAFGTAITVGAFVVGLEVADPAFGSLVIRSSEVGLAFALVVTTVLLILGSGYIGAVGWVVGFCAGAVWTQIAFEPKTGLTATLAGWGASTVLGVGLVLGYGRLRRTIGNRARTAQQDVRT